jgi:hypothetical protein
MKLVAIFLSILLVGCATNKQSEMDLKSKISQSKEQACVAKEVARYAALVEIAKVSNDAARVAAIMSMQHSSSCQ